MGSEMCIRDRGMVSPDAAFRKREGEDKSRASRMVVSYQYIVSHTYWHDTYCGRTCIASIISLSTRECNLGTFFAFFSPDMFEADRCPILESALKEDTTVMQQDGVFEYHRL